MNNIINVRDTKAQTKMKLKYYLRKKKYEPIKELREIVTPPLVKGYLERIKNEA